jgi:hypothetical protein
MKKLFAAFILGLLIVESIYLINVMPDFTKIGARFLRTSGVVHTYCVHSNVISVLRGGQSINHYDEGC